MLKCLIIKLLVGASGFITLVVSWRTCKCAKTIEDEICPEMLILLIVNNHEGSFSDLIHSYYVLIHSHPI